MTTEQKQAIQENGLLAELGYLELENYHGDLSNAGKVKDFIEENTKDTTGIDSDRKDTMIALLEQYDIVETSPTDSPTDFQGTLVKNKETGEYTVLFRGTESTTDGAVDLAKKKGQVQLTR